MKRQCLSLALGAFLAFLYCLGAPLNSLGAGVGADDFSKERALDHVKYLAGTIGPRPMGSPAEKAALIYAAQKLAEYGCQVEWQPVTRSKNTNTASFNVIGRLPGFTSREIVIGGHIDSASPEIPGADDDASGVAVTLELARIFSQEKHNSTLVFAAFCGEESGLVGSKHFVEHYPLKNVALMLQLDMASDESPLALWIDARNGQSPKWLVSASLETFHALGYRGLDYPTHFQSLNSALGGAGSDHEPFMENGIPAIAFVSDVTYPIHTRNDSLEYFKADGLERSGKLISELVKKFDSGVPKVKTGHYMLILLAGKPLFVSPTLLAAFIIVSLILTLLVLIRLRASSTLSEEDKKIRKSWPKLAILLLMIVITTIASLWVMQLVKGQRLPWFAHPGPYLPYGFVFLILGIWLALQVTRRWRLRKNPFFYFIRAAVYLGVLIVPTWLFLSPRLAFYPACGLVFLSLGCLARWRWLKGLLWLLSPVLTFRLLVVPEYSAFLYRSLGQFVFPSLQTPAAFATVMTVFGLVTFLWAMPYLLGFAAVYRSSPGDIFWLKHFRRPLALIPIGFVIIVGTIYQASFPSYSRPWEQVVSITQKSESAKNKTSIEFSSADYLKGIVAHFAGRNEMIRSRKVLYKIDYPLEMNWINEQTDFRSEVKGEDKKINLRVKLDFKKQPYEVTLKLVSDKEMSVESSNFTYVRTGKREAAISWYSFPVGSLEPELRLNLPREAKLEAEVSVTFLATPLAMSCEGENKDFVYRSLIIRKLDLSQQNPH